MDKFTWFFCGSLTTVIFDIAVDIWSEWKIKKAFLQLKDAGPTVEWVSRELCEECMKTFTK